MGSVILLLSGEFLLELFSVVDQIITSDDKLLGVERLADIIVCPQGEPVQFFFIGI